MLFKLKNLLKTSVAVQNPNKRVVPTLLKQVAEVNRRFKAIPVKHAHELRFSRITTRGLRDMVAYVNDTYFPGLIALRRSYIGDAERDDLETRIEQLITAFDGITSRVSLEIEGLQKKQASDHTKEWLHSLKIAMGLDLSGIITDLDITEDLVTFSAGTSRLIKKTGRELAENIARVTYESFRTNQSATELAKTLKVKFTEELHGKHIGRTKESRLKTQRQKKIAAAAGKRVRMKYQSRYDLIARDQTSKLNAELNRVRHEQAGITHYRWVTAGDERVRHEHSSRSQRVYSWGHVHFDGHPGEPINCRCTARPVIQ